MVGLAVTAGVFLLTAIVLFAGLLPLSMPFGLAAGGVLETGQAVPQRWWLAASIALGLFLLLGWRIDAWRKRWWLGVLAFAIGSAVTLFCLRSVEDPPIPAPTEHNVPGPHGAVGLMSALPLFWAEGVTPGRIVAGEGGGRSPLVDMIHARAVDHIDGASLRGLDTLILAQPRLLQPAELVALDDWIRRGGKAVIFADPLLEWPSELPLGDPRRAPLTSLLDPLLLHWGLRLEPAAHGRDGVDRRLLESGHMLMMAGASHFVPEGKTPCTFADDGLMALCTIGKGRVRLVADADLLDERLWLADPLWADRPEAYASDIASLLASWAADPFAMPREAAPRRVKDDATLISGLRWGLLAALFWAGLGWLGQGWWMARKPKEKREAGEVVSSG